MVEWHRTTDPKTGITTHTLNTRLGNLLAEVTRTGTSRDNYPVDWSLNVAPVVGRRASGVTDTVAAGKQAVEYALGLK